MSETLQILIVEEDAIVSNDLSDTLIRCGYEVIGLAATVDRALTLARERDPNLLLIDLRMGQGEDRSGGRSRRSNLANAFEALVGAAYLDGGMAAAETIFSRLIVPHLTAEDVDAWTANPKGRLQEYSQSHWKRSPTYRVIGSEGPPHNTRFTVQVTLEDGSFSIASGNSKQEAQSRAAGDLLTRMEAEAESE